MDNGDSGESTAWRWQSTSGSRWLTCDLLAAWPHTFGTRHSHPHKPDHSITELAWTAKQARWAHQVHGRNWLWAESMQADRDLLQADAVLTQSPTQSVWVCSADCVPLLIACGGKVAAIHAGWRGTSAAITLQVLAEFIAQGCDLKNVRVAIGPAISGAVYQVSESVAADVVQTLLSEFRAKPLLPDPIPNKVRLDIRMVNQLQLLQAGIGLDQISISPHCTYTQSEDFFSYRRDGSVAGAGIRVQWSGIGAI